VPCLSCYTL